MLLSEYLWQFILADYLFSRAHSLLSETLQWTLVSKLPQAWQFWTKHLN